MIKPASFLFGIQGLSHEIAGTKSPRVRHIMEYHRRGIQKTAGAIFLKGKPITLRIWVCTQITVTPGGLVIVLLLQGVWAIRRAKS